MKFQLGAHGWFIKDRLIPVGTVLDYRSNDDFSKLARSTGAAPPLNAVALDQEAYEAMQAHHSAYRHLIQKAFTGVQKS